MFFVKSSFYFLWAIFAATSFFAASCITRDDAVVTESHEFKHSEKKYRAIIKEKTKKATLYVDFETRVKVGVVHLDEQLMGTVKNRAIENYGVDKISALLGPMNSGEKVFLISVFSKSWDDDLKGSPNWHIELDQSNQKFAPKDITRLNQKDFLASFFDSVDNWSTEYLLRFDVSGDNQLESGPFALKVSHTDGRVIVGW